MKINTVKKTIAALAAITTVSAASCGNANSSQKYKPQKMAAAPVSGVQLKANSGTVSDDFDSAYANFTVGLFKSSCNDDLAAGKNALISPESVMFALGMTANGAGGDTLAQMEDALGTQDINTLNDDLLCLMHKANDDKHGQLRIANSVWTNKDMLKLRQDYADKLREYYAADCFSVPFGDSTHKDMNTWISNNTNGMIQDMLDKVDTNDAAYLINIAAFDAEWDKKYKGKDIKENKIFYTSDGKEQDCTLLHSEEDIYLCDDDTQGVVKPYKDGEYGFMALLPNDHDTALVDYVSELDGDKLRALWETRSTQKVETYIPEFTSDYDICMNKALQELGITSAFGDNADFTGMAENGMNIKIDKVLHSTHIELDRNGTKAAAATAVKMTKKDAVSMVSSPIVRLDRPFVYAIVDMENGMPIFIGAVNSIK